MAANNYKHIKSQNIGYYNEIASDYDQIMSVTIDGIIRKKMEDKVTSFVKEGVVLDFGGGTGLDLNWLAKKDYTIIFCEPSPAMRQIAIERSNSEFPHAKITFLNDSETDFIDWDKKLPFEEKANGVIANFAVLNCILSIDTFFKNLSLVTAANAHVFLVVLDYGIKTRLKMNFLAAVKSIFTGKSMNIKTAFNGADQLVYHHAVSSIKNASANYFEFQSCESLKEEGFSFIHLRKR